MNRRTLLKRIGVGAGSTFALAGTSTAATNPKFESLAGTEYRYRVTDDGLEKIETHGSFDTTDDCSVTKCCTCPDDCSECTCIEPC